MSKRPLRMKPPAAADLRLLLDMNLSPQLADRVRDLFPNVRHVADLLSPKTPDPQIYRFAADNGYTTVVTCDQDFDALAINYGEPRVVRFRYGTMRTPTAERLLRIYADQIIALHDPTPPVQTLLLIP